MIRLGNEANAIQDVPFITNDMNSAAELLKDTIGKPVSIFQSPNQRYGLQYILRIMSRISANHLFKTRRFSFYSDDVPQR